MARRTRNANTTDCVTRSFVSQTSLSGMVSGLLMAVVVTAASRLRTGRSASGLNAVSHITWGSRASGQSQWSLRYTMTEFILNQVACLFWAGCYKAMRETRRPLTPAQPVAHAITISLLAYVVDYHIVPSRVTPGFELVFPRAWFPSLYAGLAASLWAGAKFPSKHVRRSADFFRPATCFVTDMPVAGRDNTRGRTRY